MFRGDHDHLTGEALAKWSDLPFAYQIQHAYHVSSACKFCWAVVNGEQMEQPLTYDDPFLRALARIRLQPKVDLSLPSDSIRLFVYPPFPPSDFPSLLLGESITLGRKSPGPNRVARFLGLPSALAQLLRESPETNEAGTNLRVNVGCAAVYFYSLAEDRKKADQALEETKELFEGPGDDRARINLKMAELTLAKTVSEATSIMNDITDNEFPLLVRDPVLRFEISCALATGLNRAGATDYSKHDLPWPLSELGLGSFDHEVNRLNSLIHKARFVASLIGDRIPDMSPSVAQELENAFDAVKHHGDAYSQGLYYQLLGELLRDESAFANALSVYSSFELEQPFLEAWIKLDRLLLNAGSSSLSDVRHGIFSLSEGAFGTEAAKRMTRIIYAGSDADSESGG